MMAIKRIVVPSAVALMALLMLSACERTITRTEVVQTASNCFECHSDQNTFLVAANQQWQNSAHASGLNINRAYSSCKNCHTSEGFVAITTGQTPPPVIDNPTVIHCFTCHAPHTDGDFRLRLTTNAKLENGETFDLGSGNLCVACHKARRNVDTYVGTMPTSPVTIGDHWGPHYGVQGDMLLGSNGYEYASYTYGQTIAHRAGTSNGCVDCHKDFTSNNVVGGHTFNMRGDIIDLDGNREGIANTAPCAPCHGSLDDFDEPGIGGLAFSVQDSVKTLVYELDSLLTLAGLMEDGHPKSGVVTSADSAGAVWNLLIAGEEDRSFGIHNPRYVLDLLISSKLFITGNLGPQAVMLSASND